MSYVGVYIRVLALGAFYFLVFVTCAVKETNLLAEIHSATMKQTSSYLKIFVA